MRKIGWGEVEKEWGMESGVWRKKVEKGGGWEGKMDYDEGLSS